MENYREMAEYTYCVVERGCLNSVYHAYMHYDRLVPLALSPNLGQPCVYWYSACIVSTGCQESFKCYSVVAFGNMCSIHDDNSISWQGHVILWITDILVCHSYYSSC